MSKPTTSIALLAVLGILVVSGAAFALSRTNVRLTLPHTTLSPFANRVSLSTHEKKYLTLSIIGSSSDPIRVSGWTLKNGDATVRLPQGTLFLHQGVVNTEQAIKLYPGEKIIISLSPSPVGASFRVNTCSSLLEKFQPFTPPLRESTFAIEDGFYNDCVFAHESDANFYTGEWRVFTSASSSLFTSEHGTITLYDEQNLLVTTLSY